VLFTYPIAAAETNWLHECLSEIIQQALAAIDGGSQATNWPECIPDQRRPRLRRFTELRERLHDFLTCYADLAPAERARVRQAIEDQNEFADLFSGGRVAERREQLPGTIGAAAELLFEKAFKMLGALGIRDENYERFIELVEHRICPFCGCEYFEGVERKVSAEGEESLVGKREPLDHYLALIRMLLPQPRLVSWVRGCSRGQTICLTGTWSSSVSRTVLQRGMTCLIYGAGMWITT
jgi:hypothetical protein